MLAAVINQSAKYLVLLISSNENTKSLVIPNNVAHFLGMIITMVGAYLGNIEGVVIASIINSIVLFVFYIILIKNEYQSLKKI